MPQHFNQSVIPPKPLDINSPIKPMNTESISFKDKLLVNEMDNNISLDSPSPHQSPMDIHYDLENKTYPQTPPQDQKVSVPITIEDKQRIYYPWRHYVIIKLQGKRIPHDVLKRN